MSIHACDHLEASLPEVPRAYADEALVADLQREIEDLKAELGRSDRLATLGAMSGAVAHEINNLLTPLLSYAAFALSKPDDEELARRALERTLQTAERARDVVDSLLRTVRTPDGNDERRSALVREAVKDAIDAMVRPPQASGIELIIDVPDRLVAAISPASLQQIVLNLLLNACDAMESEPGSVIIKASVSKQNTNKNEVAGHTVELRVIDTGPGVHPEIRDSLFDPLVSSKSTRPRGEQRGGSGLGLTVCKRLVEAVGGRIALRSQPGIGTCFVVTLPGAVDQEQRIRPAA